MLVLFSLNMIIHGEFNTKVDNFCCNYIENVNHWFC